MGVSSKFCFFLFRYGFQNIADPSRATDSPYARSKCDIGFQFYGVETRVLKQAVRRNADRFPIDFMFNLSTREIKTLVSQTVIPSRGQLGGAVPMAFTEEGIAMLSSVLRSSRAVQVNIAIMRAFVRLRQMLMSNADLSRKLIALENKYDGQFKVVFEAIRELMDGPPPPPKPRIGFRP